MKQKVISSIMGLLVLSLFISFMTGCKTSDEVIESNLTPEGIIVSANAEANGDGSLNKPMSLALAIQTVQPGEVIYLLQGDYQFSEQITIEMHNSGLSDQMKTITSYDGDLVVLDFTSQNYNSEDVGSNPRGIKLEGDYWHIKNIWIQGAADNGMLITGNHNIVENVLLSGNRDTGLQISRRDSSLTSIAEWPTDNLILNCTSFDNADPDDYEDADGFAAKLTCGEGNVFDGCIAYNNADDGWDLFTKPSTGPIGMIIIKNSVAFSNGETTQGVYSEDSDGNGFKLGGSDIANNHLLINCVAFDNKAAGFTDNSNPGVISLVNCTSYNNSQIGCGDSSNYSLARAPYSSNGFVNLLSFVSDGLAADDRYRGVGASSVFRNGQIYYGFDRFKWMDFEVDGSKGEEMPVIGAADFVSLEMPVGNQTTHIDLRNDKGQVDLGDFLLIADTSVYFHSGQYGLSYGAILNEDYTNIEFPDAPEQSPVVVVGVEETLVLEPEDSSKDIAPYLNTLATEGVLFEDGFNEAADDTLFTPEYLENPLDATIGLYIETGGSPTVSDGYLTLDAARLTVGTTYRISEPGVFPEGVFNLSKPYRIVLEISGVSGLEAKKFMVYVDNNTTSMNNSVHREASKIYEAPIGELSVGELILEPEIGTETSFIQLRTESSAVVVISSIRIEYIDE